MRARALALLATFVCAVGLLSWRGAPGDAPPQDPVRVDKFTHAQHVSDVWLNERVPETWRDCRGCHRFDADHPVSAPQQVCDDCHVAGNLDRKFADGWKDDLGGYRTRTRDAFRHHTHGMLECRECHFPPPGLGREFLRDFDIVTGPAQCARCHDAAALAKNDFAQVREMQRRWFAGATDRELAARLGVPFREKPVDVAAYAKVLVEAFAGPTGGVNTTKLPVGGDFDHHDHGDIACRDCHTDIPKASAREVGTGRIPAEGCAKCHLTDERGTAARPAAAIKTETRPLWSLGAFAHADHYAFLAPGATRKPGVANALAYELLQNSETGGCDVCHTEDKAGIGTTQRDFPFEAGKSKHRYLDCTTCHDAGPWTTGETAAAPLHDSTDGAIDGKNGFGACTSCHVVGAADFVTARPSARVQRLTGSTFAFGAMTHPDITKLGVDASGRQALAECKDCHRARVPELPSRLEKRAFRHATHLPPQPTEQDCRGCHPRAESTATAAALGGDDYRTYTLATCKSCHLGSEVVEVAAEPGAAPEPRDVVAFPHGPHVAAGAKCTDCHELNADGVDVATKPAALACNQCHDHDATNGGPKAERLFGDAVQSCASCHHEDVAGKPQPVLALPAARGSATAANDPRYASAQSVFAGFADSQFHPLGGTCTDCHRAQLAPDPRYSGLRVPRADHLFGASKSPHAAGGSKRPGECLRCHWKPINGLQDGVDIGTPEERFFRRNPTDPKTRAAFGNDNVGYPGTDRAKG